MIEDRDAADRANQCVIATAIEGRGKSTSNHSLTAASEMRRSIPFAQARARQDSQTLLLRTVPIALLIFLTGGNPAGHFCDAILKYFSLMPYGDDVTKSSL